MEEWEKSRGGGAHVCACMCSMWVQCVGVYPGSCATPHHGTCAITAPRQVCHTAQWTPHHEPMSAVRSSVAN